MSQNNAAPSEGNLLKSFWNRSMDMVSKKNFQFKQQDCDPEINEDKDKDNLTAQTQKQHRRAQVRKAQIEHRRRKKDYTKELEQTVTHLRELIASTESETVILRKENTSIKETLAHSNIQYSDTSPTNIDWIMSDYQNGQQSTNVNIDYDPLVQAECLQVQTECTLSNAQPFRPGNPSTNTSSKPTGPMPDFLKIRPNQSDVAINFILALEHPCRSHFHTVPPLSTAHDSEAAATGHELMASTLLFSSAPSSTFGDADTSKVTTSWNAPSLELSTLYAMSLSLPKEDFEITPVQAWFMIVSEYKVDIVLEKAETLKSSLNELVKCWDFGAVLNQALFWEVVKRVMDENQAN
ncbi:hypothetical protein PVAG01_02430 [Phlyctema vagabunda]|uniref:Putative transcription factor kapC n=1 Tax=Phlyctema vagabunda TaxID=108571 RepID=A0ABR4PQJ4_9HELO